VSERTCSWILTHVVVRVVIVARLQIAYAGASAVNQALHNKPNLTITTPTDLVFVIHEDTTHFAYRATVSYHNVAMRFENYRSRVFVSPQTSALILELPLIYTIENRTIYTANQKTQLPGTLARSEGGKAVNDQVVNQAYDNSGVCYDFFLKAFNRDSYDGKGAPLISTVHYDKDVCVA
jgi:hypothetical protein